MDIEQMRAEFEARFPVPNYIRFDYAFGYWNEIPDDDYLSVAAIAYQGRWEAWQAAKEQAVPDGWKLVPKEPTREMIGSAHDYYLNKPDAMVVLTARLITETYRAMLAAAPEVK